MVWELHSVNRIKRTDRYVDFGINTWIDRTYQYVREVLFDGSTDWLTVNVWRRKSDK